MSAFVIVSPVYRSTHLFNTKFHCSSHKSTKVLRTNRTLTMNGSTNLSTLFQYTTPNHPLISLCIHSILLSAFILNPNSQSMLTKQALFHAAALGTVLYIAFGLNGWTLCVLFLLFGSRVTKIGSEIKNREKTNQSNDGARGPENLWGAAGAAAICATMVLVFQYLSGPFLDKAVVEKVCSWLAFSYVCAVTTKVSDTTSSEIGKAYGKTTYLITNLQRVPRGTEGAVSVEGTLAGILSSIIFGFLARIPLNLIGFDKIPFVVAIAFVSTTVESVIGAEFQSKFKLSNEFVNFLMTFIASTLAFLTAFTLNL
mmetsp:Transcript_10985/g.19843  ORF Transcript_10985/g.19843 Transcript_10985/m.19843 type:complete len:312 (-) Transcript_10985:646-1581(-)